MKGISVREGSSVLAALLLMLLMLPVAGSLSNNWDVMDTPTDDDLYSIYMLSSDEGWAVGDSGTILKWNGETWRNVASPTRKGLGSVYMLSSDEGWAAGAGGTVLKWNGETWENVITPTSNRLYSVYMLSSDEGWAVGLNGVILRWDGSSWLSVDSAGGNFFSVYMLSSDEGWAVGDASVTKWDGASWSISEIFDSPWRLFSVSFLSPEKGWAAGFEVILHGEEVSVGEGGVILEYDGSSWEELSPPVDVPFMDVYALPSESWIVGENGTILRQVVKTGLPIQLIWAAAIAAAVVILLLVSALIYQHKRGKALEEVRPPPVPE